MGKKSVGRGRPEKYTKDVVLALVKTAKATGKSLKTLVATMASKERASLSANQRKKKFHATVVYIPLLVAATRVGLSLRKLMK